ncbi:MAG TPA: hypothetical protein PLI05_11215 [Methanotrichaceae archaeon]|nr:hypothetical protein [Methanotrichaceae archaeon]HQF17621.1 hypothetical protein [Methanotrichaceae archaeon]HQI92209.1 hypothetical protein [Methanotrichaceae archaeon]
MPTIPSDPVDAISLLATSADVGRKSVVLLYWTPAEKATGYNLYRQAVGLAQRSWTLVNTQGPIRPVQTCAELQSIIPQGSPEWEMFRSALGAVQEQEAARKSRKEVGPIFSARPAPVAHESIEIDSRRLARLIEQERTDPCKALERGLAAEEIGLLKYMAKNNLKIALAMGLAYKDETAVRGTRYIYRLRPTLTDGTEVETEATVWIVAGSVQLPDPPSGIAGAAGDSKVLLTWNRNLFAFGYIVERALSFNGPFERIHVGAISYDVSLDLDGQLLSPPLPGFLDFQRWDDKGLPATHKVRGNDIAGPANNGAYYFRVASCDILGRVGPWSPVCGPVKPLDKTPPLAPGELTASISKNPRGLSLSWRKVIHDVMGHQELDPLQTYIIYRAESSEFLNDHSGLGSYQAHSLTADPRDTASMTLSWTDTDPSIFPPFGEKAIFYRIVCIDMAANRSMPSAIVSARVPDIDPPGPTSVTGTKGHPESIDVFWRPNHEPDLAGYQIYRSICDRGDYYQPDKERRCSFSLIGEVLKEKAEELFKENGRISFEDVSVPKNSPLCYAYWVRAFDLSGNLYPGRNQCPADHSEYACGRLAEGIAPPVPVITGLRASHRAVEISWAASPIQDLKAFHIYRSEDENDPGVLVGCVLRGGQIWPGRWTGVKPGCKDIPADPDPYAVLGSFSDQNLKPGQVYWYRVSALDWLGNESMGNDIVSIPAVSTFTYNRNLPTAPVIRLSATSGLGCGLTIRWDPPYDKKSIDGFLVYRSISKAGTYIQVSPIVKGNEFMDRSAPRIGDIWYKVQSIDPEGRLSEPSLPVMCRYSAALSAIKPSEPRGSGVH